jgi:Cu(I)/Ag(I) efflux system membrane fusion protein
VRGPGKFEPRIVSLGIESNGQVAVLDGVDAGDEVVTSAQFLVDSESKLREATAKMMDVLTEGSDGSSGVSGTKAMDNESMEEVGSSGMPMTDYSEHATQEAHDHD